jgi:hypothetical protein
VRVLSHTYLTKIINDTHHEQRGLYCLQYLIDCHEIQGPPLHSTLHYANNARQAGCEETRGSKLERLSRLYIALLDTTTAISPDNSIDLSQPRHG